MFFDVVPYTITVPGPFICISLTHLYTHRYSTYSIITHMNIHTHTPIPTNTDTHTHTHTLQIYTDIPTDTSIYATINVYSWDTVKKVP